MPPAATMFVREMRANPRLARDADRMREFLEKLDLAGDGNPYAIEMMEIVLEILAPRRGPVEQRFDNLVEIAEKVTSEGRR
jgi:hypothetical protein